MHLPEITAHSRPKGRCLQIPGSAFPRPARHQNDSKMIIASFFLRTPDPSRRTILVIVGTFDHDAIRIRHCDGRVGGITANLRDLSEGILSGVFRPLADRLSKPECRAFVRARSKPKCADPLSALTDPPDEPRTFWSAPQQLLEPL